MLGKRVGGEKRAEGGWFGRGDPVVSLEAYGERLLLDHVTP